MWYINSLFSYFYNMVQFAPKTHVSVQKKWEQNGELIEMLNCILLEIKSLQAQGVVLLPRLFRNHLKAKACKSFDLQLFPLLAHSLKTIKRHHDGEQIVKHLTHLFKHKSWTSCTISHKTKHLISSNHAVMLLLSLKKKDLMLSVDNQQSRTYREQNWKLSIHFASMTWK